MARKNKPRKWSNLAGQLPEDPRQSHLSPWMQEVLAIKDEKYNELSMSELKDEWAKLDEAQAAADALTSERNKQYKALELRVIEELKKVHEVAGTDMWRGDGHTFSPKFNPRPVVKDPVALRKWIEENDKEDLLTLSAPRLKSIVCEALDTELAAMMTPAQRAGLKPGDPSSGMPPPGVEVFLQTSVHHTGGKNVPQPSEDDDSAF